jgi:molybdopterin-guanine dinucleotide biosynthesis protein A
VLIGLRVVKLSQFTFEIAGLLLAGGKSTRMGRDKAHLLYQNERFLDRAYHLMESAEVKPILVSGSHSGYTCIKDKWPQKGPAAAIISSLTHPLISNATFLLVLPVDMPLLSVNTLRQLIIMIKKTETESCFFKENPLPCCIQLKAVQNNIQHLEKKPEISMKELLTKTLSSTVITPNLNEHDCFTNINTVESLSLLREKNET